MNFFYKESGETIEQGALLSVLAVLLVKHALRVNELLGMQRPLFTQPDMLFNKESGETIEQGDLLSVLAALFVKHALRGNDWATFVNVNMT